MNKQQAITTFQHYYQKIKAYRYALSLISFDDATEGPKKAYQERGSYQALLAKEMFLLQTSPTYIELIQNLEKHITTLTPTWKRVVALAKKEYELKQKIPADLFQVHQLLISQATHGWEKAKSEANFSIFQPYLEQIIENTRQFGNYYGAVDGEVYNAFVDQYEEGISVKDLDLFFETLKARIVPLLQEIQASKVQIRTDFTKRKISWNRQQKAGTYLLKVLGYDFQRGMLKESAHPFTNGLLQHDVRVTTHIYEDRFLSSLFSCAHEGGHGIYNQHLPSALHQTPLGRGASMAVHESQSRLFENMIARSKPFLQFAYPRLQKILGLKDVSLDEFYLAINEVTPSLIRTEADELTYSLHIMVRYEIEKLWMRKQLEVKDLPQKWNELYQTYLGITPPNDTLGCLQDIHWSKGNIGYFFAYALGNAYSGQIWHTLQQDLDVDALLAQGKLKPIVSWLNKNLYVHGALYPPKTVIERLSRHAFNPNYYCDYLEKKYRKIYQLPEK